MSIYSKFFFQSKCRYLSCSLKCYPLFFYVITPNMSQRFVFVITKAKKKCKTIVHPPSVKHKTYAQRIECLIIVTITSKTTSRVEK